MTEKDVKCFPVLTRVYCKECGKEMIKDTSPAPSYFRNPTKYKYDCVKCGRSVESYKNYPIIEYKEIE